MKRILDSAYLSLLITLYLAAVFMMIAGAYLMLHPGLGIKELFLQFLLGAFFVFYAITYMHLKYTCHQEIQSLRRTRFSNKQEKQDAKQD